MIILTLGNVIGLYVKRALGKAFHQLGTLIFRCKALSSIRDPNLSVCELLSMNMNSDVNKLKIYFDNKKDVEDVCQIYIPNVIQGGKRIWSSTKNQNQPNWRVFLKFPFPQRVLQGHVGLDRISGFYLIISWIKA